MLGSFQIDRSLAPTPGRLLGDSRTRATGPVARTWQLEDRQSVAMLDVFDRHGGVLTTDAAVALLRPAHDQPVSLLAHWIVSRDVLHFVWNFETVLPRFQFNRWGTGIRDEVACVLCELRKAFDDWSLATWFATPNNFLSDLTPVDALSDDPQSVIQAARLDRFIALG